MSKRADALRLRIRRRNHELEGRVIDAIEAGATDVWDVIDYCEERMDKVDHLRACREVYRMFGIKERLNVVPTRQEAILL